MSLQKTSLPAFLMFAGGAIATAGVVLVVGAVVVVAAFLLLPPQPAARTATRARTASPAADGIFIRCMLGPFLCRSLGRLSMSWRVACYLPLSQTSSRYVFRTEAGYSWLRAEVAELADAPDSKSGGAHAPCGFDSHLRHSRRPGNSGTSGPTLSLCRRVPIAGVRIRTVPSSAVNAALRLRPRRFR